MSSYILTHKSAKATLTAIVNGHRITIATMSAPKVHMTRPRAR